MAADHTTPNPHPEPPPDTPAAASEPAPIPPLPRLVTAARLPLPRLPDALAGLRILVAADLHVRAARSFHDRLVDAIGQTPHDLLVLLGDYMHAPGHEAPAAHLLGRIARASQPAHGRVGVWGNHDTPALRQRLAHLPITWLANASHPLPTIPLTLLGLECWKYERRRPQADLLTSLLDTPAFYESTGSPRTTILLSHLPTWLPEAADLGVDLVLAGHTHGGQIRLPGKIALRNNTPNWPLKWSAGHLKLGSTHLLIPRGLGEGARDGLRIFCPPQLLHVTLDPSPPDASEPHPTTVQLLQKW